jgi:hypothetical protein
MIADDAQKIDPGARPRGELFASAVNSGMRTLKMDGWRRF